MKKIFSLLATILFAGSMMAEPVTLTFKDWADTSINTDGNVSNQAGDCGTAYTVDNLCDSLENSNGFVTCSATTKAYPGRVNMGCKLGSSKAIGSIDLALATPAEFDSIVVNAASYSATEGSLSICGGEAIDLTDGGQSNKVLRNVKYVPTGVVSTFSLATTVKRAYVKSITFYPKAGVTPEPEPEPTANIFDATTTTLETWFASGASWDPETQSTGTWENGVVTLNFQVAKAGQWRAQVKLHTTGIVLDPAKNYEFKCSMNSNNALGGVTVKVFDDSQLSYIDNLALATGDNEYVSAPFAGGSVGNGVIVFDFGFAQVGDVITISNIALVESNQEIVVPTEPKPTTAPAAPTADAATVLSVYSNTYPAASAVGYCEGWGQTTALEELNLDGNTVLYYKNFNYLGWGVANPIDASTCTGLHLDIWANGAGNINVWPIFGGAGLSTDDSKYATVALVEGWNSVDLDFATNFAGLDLTSIFQFKFADLTTTDKVVAIDNVYFYGYVAPAVVYKSLAEVYNLAKNDVVDLKAFDVVYVNGSNIYVKDATAAGLLYANNYGLVAGDHVAAGLQGTVDIYNGIYEVKPTTAYTDLTVTAGEAPAPAVATAAPTAADQNKYVVYKDVTFNVADTLTNAAKTTAYGVFKGDTVVFYNNFMIAASFEAGKTYDVVAVNAMYKTAVQVYPIEITEHETISVECDGEHGLYNPATAAINATYLAPGWDPVIAGADHYAEMENGNIVLHVGAQGYGEMWNGQVFVDPGFTFEEGKAYHYEFDIISAGKVCVTVKVNDNDADEGAHIFFAKTLYDLNIGGGVYHFSTDSVFAKDGLNTARGPLVFGFGWTDADQDVIISCIKITEAGDAPEPVEEKMYMKHPWGTGANDDWTWKELEKTTFKNVKAWTITEAWGGVGFNIADNAEGKDASWYAAETIQFLDADGALVEAPAVGTAGCAFYFVPAFVGGITTPAYVVVPAAQGILNATQNNAVKAIVNGNVVIIRNGVRYNLVGARF